MDLSRMAARIAFHKSREITFEVYDLANGIAYDVTAIVHPGEKKHPEVEFIEFKRQDTGRSIDEEAFWKIFDKDAVTQQALDCRLVGALSDKAASSQAASLMALQEAERECDEDLRDDLRVERGRWKYSRG